MPRKTIEKWVKPERFLLHKGVSVYYSYRDDDVDNEALEYWFTMTDDPKGGYTFDVRELPGWKNHRCSPHAAEATIKEAIESGALVGMGVSPLDVLERLAEKVERANSLQHSRKSHAIPAEDWAELHQLTSEARAVIKRAKKEDA
jgi:hypothetical protein